MWTLATEIIPRSSLLRSYAVQQVPGDDEYPDPATDYLAIGIYHAHASPSGNYLGLAGAWGHLLTKYEPAADEPGYGGGAVILGKVVFPGKVKVGA